MSHRCETHKQYRLTCDQFEALAARAGGVCERCRVPDSRLQIDHDHAIALNAVRGLICARCNFHLGRVDAGAHPASDVDRSYLSNAWHLTAGLPEYVVDNRTTVRTVRIDHHLWSQAGAIARRRSTTLTAVIKAALVDYVELHTGEPISRPPIRR